jgi:hypothetical protein
MATLGKFEDLVQRIVRSGFVRARTQRAVEWIRSITTKLKNTDEKTILNQAPAKSELTKLTYSSVGKMYSFVYDPKLKQELPYYDTFPLIFVVKFEKDGFLGINLHYLPPLLRAKLMDPLYDLINNDKYNETTKLNISYKILNNATRFRYFKPCLKKYLFTHVRSKFLYITPNEWEIAMMLPTEKFKKESKETVWADSVKMVQ